MKLSSILTYALIATGVSISAMTDAAADPVNLPCAPNCTPIPPCELDPNKPGCPGQGGPIPSTTTNTTAPNPPAKDKVAPVVPPPPDPPRPPQ